MRFKRRPLRKRHELSTGRNSIHLDWLDNTLSDLDRPTETVERIVLREVWLQQTQIEQPLETIRY